ncbi:MAG: YkgJ family cysteine cluster protein [Deltaproteobacteria bacterium]|nr:YkgJ family cysteine cluster protein [Deltaproteobacteria bacterium]
MVGEKNIRWFEDGLEFKCVGCGRCCRSHGRDNEKKYVYLSYEDKLAISSHLKIPMDVFFFRYCTYQDGAVVLQRNNGGCCFHEYNRCQIYQARPKQCATWPFWTENLHPEEWYGPVKDCCPGIGQGKTYGPDEIEKIAAIRDQWYGIER